MRKRIILIFVLSYFTFAVFFLYAGIGSLEEGIKRADRDLEKVIREVRRKNKTLNQIRNRLGMEGIRIYTREQALEKLLTVVDSFRSDFKVTVRGDLRSERNKWIMDISVSFKPTSSTHLRDVVARLSSMKEPIIFIKSLALSESKQPEGGEVIMDLTVVMPFMERS